MKQEAKHTPGPWKLNRNAHGWYLKTKCGCVLGGINRFPDTAELASQCEPNARLIAASPDMLDALKASRAILASILGTDAESIIIAEQVAIIDAAIAKAEAKP